MLVLRFLTSLSALKFEYIAKQWSTDRYTGQGRSKTETAEASMVHTTPLPTLTTTVSTYVPTGQHAGIKTPKPPVTSSDITSSSVLEAKIVVLGAAGVGKTSIVARFVDPKANLPTQWKGYLRLY